MRFPATPFSSPPEFNGDGWRFLGVDRLQGAGVYYGGGSQEAASYKGETVYVVGGANSAGQAAMNFAQYADKVVMLLRGDSLSATMSRYLIDQIEKTPNIQLWTHAEVIEVHGETHLEEISVQCSDTNTVERAPASAMFIYIGALPRTDWLDKVVARDERGFILAGPDLLKDGKLPSDWSPDRDPFLLEAACPASSWWATYGTVLSSASPRRLARCNCRAVHSPSRAARKRRSGSSSAPCKAC